ncbi:MAG: Gfo/Idh/MocA family protein [Granulosicoccus sp.]
MRLRAGIIGAGGIAWRYDGGAWNEKNPSITLASCLDRHPETQLVAVFDPIAEARQAFDRGYQGPRPVELFEHIGNFLNQDLDLVAIASPSEYHASHIEACFEASVPRLWIEKPVTLHMDDFWRIREHYRSMESQPRTCVNYQRRCLPQVKYMKDYIAQSPDSPEAMAISITYSRQLEVNGVHLLDLLGYITDAQEAPSLDFIRSPDLANPQFGLTLKGHPVTITGHDLPYHLIEISITDRQGRLSLVRGATELIWECAEPNPDYPGFFRIAHPQSTDIHVKHADSLQESTYQMLCALIDNSVPSPSTIESAWFAQTLLDRVKQAGTPHR